MLDMNDAKCCYLHNTTTAEILGIAAGAYKLVLGDYAFRVSYDGGYVGMYLSDGRLRLCDFKKVDLSINSAYTIWSAFGNQCQKYKDSFLYPHSDAGDFITKIHWNLSAFHLIYDIIGADLLMVDWTGRTATQNSVLAKLDALRTYIDRGLLTEASIAIDSILTDDFLTIEKIAEYKSYINSCNIFNV